MHRLLPFLLAAALMAAAPSKPLTAVASASTIRVGESATVTFSGGQLEVAGGNTIDNIGSEFAHAVTIKRLGPKKMALMGVAACDCVLQFTDGRNNVSVRLRVLKK